MGPESREIGKRKKTTQLRQKAFDLLPVCKNWSLYFLCCVQWVTKL